MVLGKGVTRLRNKIWFDERCALLRTADWIYDFWHFIVYLQGNHRSFLHIPRTTGHIFLYITVYNSMHFHAASLHTSTQQTTYHALRNVRVHPPSAGKLRGYQYAKRAVRAQVDTGITSPYCCKWQCLAWQALTNVAEEHSICMFELEVEGTGSFEIVITAYNTGRCLEFKRPQFRSHTLT